MNDMDERLIRPMGMGFGRPGFGFHHGFHHHGFGMPLLGFGTGLLAGSLINRPYGYYGGYPYGGYPYGGYPYGGYPYGGSPYGCC